MTHEDVANIIRSNFAEFMAALYPSMIVQYDNHDIDHDADAFWCRLSVLFGDDAQLNVGNVSQQIYKTDGLVKAQLFGPLALGDGELLRIADAIKSQYRSKEIDGVHFLVPSIKPRGLSEGYWQINVDLPFYSFDS